MQKKQVGMKAIGILEVRYIDPYNFIYYVTGDEKALKKKKKKKKKDPEPQNKNVKLLLYPTMQLNGFITKLSYGQQPKTLPNCSLD